LVVRTLHNCSSTVKAAVAESIDQYCLLVGILEVHITCYINVKETIAKIAPIDRETVNC